MEGKIYFFCTEEELKAMISDAVSTALLKNQVAEEKPLTSEEIRRFYGISNGTLQTWRNAKKIPFRRVGGKIFYDRADVMQAIKREPAQKVFV